MYGLPPLFVLYAAAHTSVFRYGHEGRGDPPARNSKRHRRRSPVRQNLPRALLHDASVYPNRAIGVVIPKNREDISAPPGLSTPALPITMRGGGRRRPARPSAKDCKSTFRMLQPHPGSECRRTLGACRARHSSGRTERPSRPLGLRFRTGYLNRQPRHHRRHDGNNSSGARSVLYGKTIDHVLEQTVLLSDGSIAQFKEIARDEIPTGRSLEANATARFCGSREHAG